MASTTDRDRRILDVVRKIPRGTVATYGQVATLADLPRGHRQVARALSHMAPDDSAPWQRVVGKVSRTRARIAVRDPETFGRQRRLLEQEGVRVDAEGKISLAEYGWLPLD